MILYREGPSLLFIRSNKAREVGLNLLNLEGIREEINALEAIRSSDTYGTAVFITDGDKTKTKLEDSIFSFSYPDRDIVLLTKLHNLGILRDVTRLDIGPSIVFLYSTGDKQTERMKETLLESFKGRDAEFEIGVEIGEVNDTLVIITTERLSTLPEIYSSTPTLILPTSKTEVIEYLKKNILKLFLETLEDRDLTEIGISIYDYWNLYDLHRERIHLVFTDLNLGFLVNEYFTTDSPRFLMKIVVYLMKFITPFRPCKIKRILVALEFDETGKRLCDIDLLIGGKKFGWHDMDLDLKKYPAKEKLALDLRQELMNMLSPKAREELLRIEREILSKIPDE